MPYALIVHHRTLGLAADAKLLKGLLERGHNMPALTVSGPESAALPQLVAQEVARQQPGEAPAFVVTLEHVWDPFPAAPLVLVPNPEWFTQRDASVAARRVRTFWHKTRVSEQLFRATFPDALHDLVGWTSPEPPPVPPGTRQDFNLCLHVKGASEQKQTGVVLRAWQPHWPVLHVVTYLDVPGFVELPWPVSHRNVVVHYRKLPRAELEALQRACGVHVCCSDAEGFGHYINEGRAHGALIVTTDAAPMNELVDESCGLLVAPSEYRGHRASALRGFERALIDAAGLAGAMDRLQRMPTEERRRRGRAAAERYRAEREALGGRRLRVAA